jgi:hypothetical protein
VLFPRAIPASAWFVTLLLLSSITSAFKVNLPLARSGSTMSVSYASISLAHPARPAPTMIVGAISAWSAVHVPDDDEEPAVPHAVQHGEPRHQRAGRGRAFHALGGVAGLTSMPLAAMAKPLLGAASAYFLCNTALVATAIAFYTRQNILRVWNENFLWSAPSYFVGAVAAAGVSIVIGGTTNYWIALLAAPPLYLTYRSYKIYLGRIEDEQRHVQEVSDLHLATIEALALAIRRQRSHGQVAHPPRAGVCRGPRKSHRHAGKRDSGREDRGAACTTSASWPSPSTFSRSPGRSRRKSFQKIRIHPQVGAEIIAGVPFPYPVAPLILSHHERWDGKGYPAGMKGDEIPAGARILAVVDYFDALTSERPITRR